MTTRHLLFLTIFLSTTAFAQDFKHKAYCKDTSLVSTFVSTTLYCNRKEVDTSYMMRRVSTFSKENFAIYYDKKLTRPALCFFIKNDTAFGIYYYRNGQKKKEDRQEAKDNFMMWFYSAEWCENGKLTYEGNPNDTVPRTSINYHCNGKKRFEAFFYRFRPWGKISRWYDNGQLSTQEQYTEFDKKMIDDGKLESKLLSVKYWDEKGDSVDFIDIHGQKLNALNFPIQTWDLKQFQTDKDTAVDYSTVNGKYGFSTADLKNKIYETTIINKPKCKYGVVYVNFVIDVDGKITYLYLQRGTDRQFENAFLESLLKLDKWKPTVINGKPAKIATALELEVEKISPKNISNDNDPITIDCSNFKVGKFIYKNKITSDSTIIERTATKQIERNLKTGELTEYLINWSSNCDYELTLITSSNENIEEDEPSYVRIIKTANNGYEYILLYKNYVLHNRLDLLNK